MRANIGGVQRTIYRKWKRVQNASLAVMLLSQRDEDERLWYYPSSLFEELQTLAPPESAEAAIKAHPLNRSPYGRFGNASITVTWKALTGIEAATGLRPLAAHDVLRDLDGFKSPRGCYGSRVSRHPVRTINECARHTAMALLIQMSFGHEQSAHAILTKFETPIRWLVMEAILERGGWAFEQTARSQAEGLGATSTVACVMALSKFYQLCEGSEFEASELGGTIRQKVSASLDELVAASNQGTWDLRNEGLPLETRVAESAYVISGLRHAIERAALLKLYPNAAEVLRHLQVSLLSVGLPLKHGWPSGLGGLSVSPAASICALHALIDFDRNTLPAEARSFLSAAESRILVDVCRDNGWEFLRTWDWATLAEISSTRIGPMMGFKWRRLAKSADLVQRAKQKQKVGHLTLWRLPKDSRGAIEYVLSRGGRVLLRDSIVTRAGRLSLDFFVRSSWAVWTAGIGLILGYVLSRVH